MTVDFNKAVLGLLLIAVAMGLYRVAIQPPPAPFAQPPEQVPTQVPTEGPSHFTTAFASSRQNTRTHAASLVELRDGRVRAFWFGGSREGASDVQIRSAVFNPDESRWSAERVVADRATTQRALLRYIKKLGNPVVARTADGALLLCYVTVSLGGWSGSSITTMASHDDGATWESARRLITSPFLNVSTLVKGTPYRYADGTLALPVYHELLGKFGEIVRLDSMGRMLDKQRVSTAAAESLQPVLLIENAHKASILMRYAGAAPRRVTTVATEDAGQHWSAVTKTSLANPNAAVSALVLSDGGWLAVLNDQESGRGTLSLKMSYDGGQSWKLLHQLEGKNLARAQSLDEQEVMQIVARQIDASGIFVGDVAAEYVESIRRVACRNSRCNFEFSYPYMIQTHNGDIHIAYTYSRAFIKHIRFNPMWLQQRRQQAR